MKIITILIGLTTLFTLSNCKRFDDIVLEVKVVNKRTEEPVPGIRIDVFKMKTKDNPRSLLGTYSKKVDVYLESTDKNGISKIRINNYNPKKYWYIIEINSDLKPIGNYIFQCNPIVLKPSELNELLVVRGNMIPMPDPLPHGP